MLFVFVLWVCVFIYVFIKLCLVADRISSPIRKLIKTISLSQLNINTDEMKFEQIYYPEDKDINDLFQICQKLIFGGVKSKTNIRKKKRLNVKQPNSSFSNYPHSLTRITLLLVSRAYVRLFKDFFFLPSLPLCPIKHQILAIPVLPN
jgi:hypothetical protein